LQAEIQDFLDTDVLNISVEQCSGFLNPLIESWAIDLKSFNLEVRLSNGLASCGVVRFQYAEASSLPGAEEEPGFKEFLRNPGMSATPVTRSWLPKSLKFHRPPRALPLLRELSLRIAHSFIAQTRHVFTAEYEKNWQGKAKGAGEKRDSPINSSCRARQRRVRRFQSDASEHNLPTRR
jgi:hypothetical protein